MRSSNLCLHVNAIQATRDQVFAVPTPERTDTWVPIAHGRLLESVESTLKSNGMNVVTEAHGLTKDGNRFFGLLQVGNTEYDNSSSGHLEYGLVVGIRNSHDKSYPAGLVLGASVFVCDNLSFSGEVKLARKHTAMIERDLPQLVNRAVGMLSNLKVNQEKRFEAYKDYNLNDVQAHDLIVRAIDARAVPVTKIPEVLQEWRKPSHEEFQDRTAWSLFNSFTEVLKGHLSILPTRTQALHGLFDSACGLALAQGFKNEDAEIVIANAG